MQTGGRGKAEPGEHGGPGEQAAAAGRKAEEVSHLSVGSRFWETFYWRKQLSHVIYPRDPRARCLKT